MEGVTDAIAAKLNIRLNLRGFELCGKPTQGLPQSSRGSRELDLNSRPFLFTSNPKRINTAYGYHVSRIQLDGSSPVSRRKFGSLNGKLAEVVKAYLK